jgi:flagellar assembly factor FliW
MSVQPELAPPASEADAAVSGVDAAEAEIDLPRLRFVRPLPGFPDLTDFALVRLDHAGSEDDGDGEGEAQRSDDATDPGSEMTPLLFELRCLQAPDVRFLVCSPSAFFPDYGFDLDQDMVDELDLVRAEDAMVLVVLTVGADAASSTANLLAPVIVNARNRQAAQVILSGTDWPVRAAVV